MNTNLLTTEGISMLSDQYSIKHEIARIQVLMMQKRLEKKYEELLDLENKIDELQRLLIVTGN